MVPPEIKMPNKKRLNPTNIMVVDTISAVKSLTLLKVLLIRDPHPRWLVANVYLDTARLVPSNRNTRSTHWQGPAKLKN